MERTRRAGARPAEEAFAAVDAAGVTGEEQILGTSRSIGEQRLHLRSSRTIDGAGELQLGGEIVQSHSRSSDAATIWETGVMGGTFFAFLLAALACAVLALATTSARAATPGQSYGYRGDIGAPGASQFSETFFNPVAVSEDGRIFSMRQSEQNVEILEPDGTVLTHAVAEGPFGPEVPGGIATSADGTAIYVTPGNGSQFGEAFGFSFPVVKLVSDGGSPPAYTQDATWTNGVPIGKPGGIATDPSTGDVWIASQKSGIAGSAPVGIYRFDASTGALISSFNGSTAARGPFIAPSSIAVAPDGDVYVADTEPNRVEHMGADGSWKASLPLNSQNPNPFWKPLGVAVNPQNADVAVLQPASDATAYSEPVINIYTPSDLKKETILVPPAASATPIKGLAFSPDGTKLYLATTEGIIHVFDLGNQPGLDAPVASEISAEGARISGVVGTGSEPTGAHLEYCLASEPCEEYLSSAGASPWRGLPDHTGLTNDQEEISDTVSGLAPNTRYLIRSYAIDEGSRAAALSAIGSFRTAVVAPGVQTGAAGGISDTVATLSGSVTAFGDQTTYRFEYGPTTNYGSQAPAGTDALAGAGATARSFSQTIRGLTPGTLYHFRIVATNSAGPTYGEDRTFTTLAADQVQPARVYEQVTPTEKNGVAIIPRQSIIAERDGEGVAYQTKAGSRSSPIQTRSVALRNPTDWIGRIDTDPPLNVGGGGFLIHPTLAVSEDFTHALVVSNRALRPGAIEGGANLYVEDLSSHSLQFVGTSNAKEAFNKFVGASTTGTYQAGSPDLSWVVFVSGPPLLPGAPAYAAYRWSASGGLEIVSLLPDHEASTVLHENVQQVYDVVSEDGSRIYYTAIGGSEEGVFLRENGGPPRIVSHEPGDPTTPVPAVLLGTDKEGRFAFLTSSVKLTSDAPGEPGDLYRYDASDGNIEFLGVKAEVDLTTGNLGTAIAAGSLGIGEDGQTIYFNQLAQFGNELSAWHDGTVHTIMSGKIFGGREQPSPNGRYFAFEQTVDGVEHVVELYDATTEESSCVSCLPDGTPVPAELSREGSSGDQLLGNRAASYVTNAGVVFFNTMASLLPADVNGTQDVYAYKNGSLALISPGDQPFEAVFADASPSGDDVFFTTAQALVGRDTDESIDIYDARVNGGLAAQNPPPAQECRSQCKPPVGAPPVNPAAGSEALNGPGNVVASKVSPCGKGKHKAKVGGKTRCVKKQPKKRHHHQARKHQAGTSKKGGGR